MDASSLDVCTLMVNLLPTYLPISQDTLSTCSIRFHMPLSMLHLRSIFWSRTFQIMHSLAYMAYSRLPIWSITYVVLQGLTSVHASVYYIPPSGLT